MQEGRSMDCISDVTVTIRIVSRGQANNRKAINELLNRIDNQTDKLFEGNDAVTECGFVGENTTTRYAEAL